MKKSKKSFKGLALVMAMALTFGFTGITAQAQTKTSNITLLKGEKVNYSYIGLGTIKKVKTSNKKIVAAKKYQGGSRMTAKKVGKANITVTGTNGNWIHKVTVKKPDFKVKYSSTKDGDILVSLQNKTSVYVDNFTITLIFKDSQGNQVTTKSAYMYYVGPKAKAYEIVNNPAEYYSNIDLNKTTYKITYNRSADATYKKYSAVTFSDKKTSNNYIAANAKTKYKGNGYIYIAYEVKFYDVNKNLIDVTCYTASLSKSVKSKTTEIYMPSSAASYKITKRVYLKNY